MRSNIQVPVNIGSDEMVSINKLVDYVAEIANNRIHIKHIPGPVGVQGRNSDNRLIRQSLNWAPTNSLKWGLNKNYSWITSQVQSM